MIARLTYIALNSCNWLKNLVSVIGVILVVGVIISSYRAITVGVLYVVLCELLNQFMSTLDECELGC